MVSDRQVLKMRTFRRSGEKIQIAALKSGMSERTARRYLGMDAVPSEAWKAHRWRTRSDPFGGVWDEVRGQLERFPGLEAKTLLGWLQRQYPDRFQDGQLRTLQRQVKLWRATEGPAREVFFPQEHFPGELCESDFTEMGSLGVTIQGQPFAHLVYHFVLTYSNWEAGRVCFSESYESLSWGLQSALWELGGVPRAHRTDRLSSAVNNLSHVEEFTRRYEALLGHYGLKGEKTQAGRANENGDIEQRHHRLKESLDQWLMLRGSREFEGRQAYETFLREMFVELNRGRRERFAEEQQVLRSLPSRRLEDAKRLWVRVGPSSTIAVQGNVYSVHSRLVREQVEVRVYPEHLEVWHGQRCVERLLRIRGKGRHSIQYRHIIDWLVRKPGAFAHYQYRSDLFPTTRFRMAYDVLVQQSHPRADKEYLKILSLAARETELGVEEALRRLLESGWAITAPVVQELVQKSQALDPARDPAITAVDLAIYDGLLEGVGEVAS